MAKTAKMPIEKWTNGGSEVFVLRFVDRTGKAYGGFQHPMNVGERVTAPDWNPNAQRGGGIHGWAWGIGLGEGKDPDPDWDGLWQVYGVEPDDIVDLDGKVKFKTGLLRFIGTWNAATNFVLPGQMAWVHKTARGAASATGERGAASATGESGAASATGESGAASATGARGAASATGARGAASATGERGAASATGRTSAAVVTSLDGKAMAGEGGCIALAWFNTKSKAYEMVCDQTGSKRKLKPNVWYQVDSAGKFVEVSK